MGDLLKNLQRIGDCELDDITVAHEALAEIVDLRLRIAELEAVAEKYRELLYQVACKFPNETRHETALRYLKERETPAMTADQCCEAILGGGG